MKKIVALLLSVMLITGIVALPAFSEAETGTAPKNYLTGGWTDGYFAGTLTESEEDGETVTTYVPSAAYSWLSPSLSIFQDLKKMIGENRGVTVVLTFEIRGVFANPGSSVETHILIRACNPKTGQLAYPADQIGDWDGNGYTWKELYDEVAGGDLQFQVYYGDNNYCYPVPENVTVASDSWTKYESDPIYVSAEELDETLFKDWFVCFDNISYDSNLKGFQFKNTAIINYEETRPTKAPAEDPTEEPTKAPEDATTVPVDATTAPAPTDAAKTDVPDGKATDAPRDDNGDNKDASSGPNVGLIIGIVCGVVAVAAVVAVIVARKKKGKK